MVSTAFGVLAAAVVAWFVPWQLTVLVGWDVTAAIVVGAVWLSIGGFSAEETKEFAVREDDTRTGTHLLLIGAALVSLVGVLLAFLKGNSGTHREEVALETFGVITIVLSWLLVHTVYALKYAHLYYSEPEGGIDYKSRGAEDPDYLDFAYTAFTVGMTYQVSDTDITRREVRRQVLHHALISFLFGAVILATMVNVIATLLNS